MVPLDKRLQWVNKTKAVQTDLGTFRHNQAYPGITQTYSGIYRTLCNPNIFRTVEYHYCSGHYYFTTSFNKA